MVLLYCVWSFHEHLNKSYNHISERKILHAQSNIVNNHSSEKRLATEKVLSSLAHEAAMDAIGQRKTHSNSNSPALSMFNSSTSVPSLTYSLGMYTRSTAVMHSDCRLKRILMNVDKRKLKYFNVSLRVWFSKVFQSYKNESIYILFTTLLGYNDKMSLLNHDLRIV